MAIRLCPAKTGRPPPKRQSTRSGHSLPLLRASRKWIGEEWLVPGHTVSTAGLRNTVTTTDKTAWHGRDRLISGLSGIGQLARKLCGFWTASFSTACAAHSRIPFKGGDDEFDRAALHAKNRFETRRRCAGVCVVILSGLRRGAQAGLHPRDY